jgi:hypothetical protein
MKTKIYSIGSAILALWLFASMQLMAQQPSITLLQPTGPNVELTAGGTHVISWLDNFPGTVDVLVSNDGGATYAALAMGVTGSTYYWNTSGYVLGNKYRIRVQSHLSPQIYDESSHNIKLVDQVDGFITLEQPTGGEVWAENNTYVISWNDNLNEPVNVYLLKNNAVLVLLTQTTGTTYYWTVPTGLANNSAVYKIKIESTYPNATTPPAISGKFKIHASAGTFIDILQPAGGEKWAWNTTHVISWNDDVPEPVIVELWKGNTLTTYLSTSHTGSTYYWTIPNTLQVGNNYRIIIRSTLDNNLFDKSKKFSITKSEGSFIEVLQPNGGESWAQNNTYVISWNDDVPEPVNVELWKGASKVQDIATGVVGSTYYWTIDASVTPSNKYRIYVRSTVDNNLFDRSDAKFSITKSAGNYVEVIQPNGGESWARGNTYLISWIDDMPEPVNIELWFGGSKVSDIATSVYGTTYWWTIPTTQTTGNKYRIYIRSTVDNNFFDKSDAKFSITASTGTYVEVYQPNGGESWARGTAHLISWNDDFLEPVNIELWKGGSLNSTIATNVYGSTYIWNIPSTQATGSNYKVKVYSTLDGSLKDFSDAKFSITASGGTYLSVNQPNGGEYWAAGSSHWIAWDDDLPEAVNIELWKGGSKDSDIALNVTGSTYSWTIPVTQTPGGNYKVRIVSTLDNSIDDFSDAKFSIVPPTLLIAYPNPADHNVTIDMQSMKSTGKYTVQLYNQFKKLLREYKTDSYQINIPTGDLGNGIYFVVVSTNNLRETVKVIVLHK